jgi:hypothetical protein
MLVLGRCDVQGVSTVPAEVLIGAIPILRQMLEARCCVTNAAIEMFLLKESIPWLRGARRTSVVSRSPRIEGSGLLPRLPQ